MPGRDGAEGRGWGCRGRGARAVLGGPRRAPPETKSRAAAPGLPEAEAGPRDPHPTRNPRPGEARERRRGGGSAP